MTKNGYGIIAWMDNLISAFQGLLILIVTTLNTPVAKVTLPVATPQVQVGVVKNSTPGATIEPSFKLQPSYKPEVLPTAVPSGVSVEQTKAQEEKPPIEANMVRAQDSIDYMNQKTDVYIDIPQNGGKISGKISGLCNGDISGDFNGQTVDYAKTSDRKDIQGEVRGTCKVGFIPLSGSARFFGEVSLKTGWVSLTVDVEKPFFGRYYHSLRVR